MSDSAEAIVGELDIFHIPMLQKAVISGEYVQFKPAHAINQESPITFEISGSGDRLLDTSRTLLHLKVRALDAANQPLGDAAVFSVANNLASSIFQEVSVEYNQTLVSSSNQLYHIKSYLQNMLNYNETAKNTHLTAALWYTDESYKFDDPTAVPALKRASFLRNGQQLELFSRLHCDVLNCPNYLLSGVDVRLTFRRNNDAFIFLSGDGSRPRLIIDDATLYVRQVTIAPNMLLAQAKLLEAKVATYPFKRTEMLHYSIPAGTYSKVFENINAGRTPSRIILCFIKNSSLVGSYAENPFNLQHCNLNYLNVSLNGATLGSKPLTPNFDRNEYIIPYLLNFYGCGIQSRDDGFCVGRTDFAGGNTLYVYDTTADLSASETDHWSLPANGPMRVEVGFSKALETTISLICLLEHREILNIDRARQCSLTYKN